MDPTATLALTPELGHGERFLWTGRPRLGVRLVPADVFMVPFSLFWCGFVVFWESAAIGRGAPLGFRLFGLPFVAIGIYLIVGRFFVDARRRSRTFYGVTNRRILIAAGVFERTLTSLDLHRLDRVDLRERSDGSGTISFGPHRGSMPEWMASSWPGARSELPPQFEMLVGVRAVYDLIRESQRTAETG